MSKATTVWYRVVLIGLRERCKREKVEDEIDCNQRDWNQGPSLEAIESYQDLDPLCI